MTLRIALLVGLLSLAGHGVASPPKERVRIGSKAFPESWILGAALASLAESSGDIEVEHAQNLGGTEIVFSALESGEIDIYPEYTGTIAEVLMKNSNRPSPAQMRDYLAARGLGMTPPLGFNDSYALAIRSETQEELGLAEISDLVGHPELRVALSHEFLGRRDGFPGLSAHYGLEMRNVRGIQHDLAYAAIASEQTDVIDIYTTDAQIARLGLKTLTDDRHFFPRYDAVLLYRLDLPERKPSAFASIGRLIGQIDEEMMIHANGLVVLERRSVAEAADSLITQALGSDSPSTKPGVGVLSTIAANTITHLKLVAISLVAAILLGVPLGIVATRSRPVATTTLAVAGLFQTIPSLALLAFLIPLLGIGPKPALVALFLYSLLPIIRNTYTGLTTILPNLSEAAEALGLSSGARLRRIYLPMASPSILAGIKTSAVINIGTATLAALIGAGGLGNPILQGIALRDHGLILQGAIPAAGLAVVVQYGFDLADRLLIPRGLRVTSRF